MDQGQGETKITKPTMKCLYKERENGEATLDSTDDSTHMRADISGYLLS